MIMNNNIKVSWLDVYFSKYRLYRKLKKGVWYKHKTTKDINQICLPENRIFWARYGEINRYSRVIDKEIYRKREKFSDKQNDFFKSIYKGL